MVAAILSKGRGSPDVLAVASNVGAAWECIAQHREWSVKGGLAGILFDRSGCLRALERRGTANLISMFCAGTGTKHFHGAAWHGSGASTDAQRAVSPSSDANS